MTTVILKGKERNYNTQFYKKLTHLSLFVFRRQSYLTGTLRNLVPTTRERMTAFLGEVELLKTGNGTDWTVWQA